ncbi:MULTISPECIES: hypothetical protein [Protofrankia]|uniref:Uncharacterized protein n=1 Tax=Protofrankia coriariae TaxID=1562887 RepID=A0ABR5F4F5_9ACTN|nr:MULTISPECIES: hypothetical protein [Protofrankia]KLL11565.1 hypothetical protein FrCorBMG51_11030 [Protofrankia coriariae]ONH35699.1 hypothetical protein BL254_10425 [Protofrankia sp. BMG5.30]
MSAHRPGMPNIRIQPDIEAAPWTDITVANSKIGTLDRIGLLRHGTTSGRATVGLAIRLEDGTYVIAETTWRLLRGAVRALAASPIGQEETDD